MTSWNVTSSFQEYNVVEEAMRAIGKYCSDHGIKIVDLFARFDTDDSMSVSHEEFAQGLRVNMTNFLSYYRSRSCKPPPLCKPPPYTLREFCLSHSPLKIKEI